VGDNTDVEGIAESLTLLLGPPSSARFEVRLLGAGGSAAAALVALERWPGATVSIWSRHAERAIALCERLRPGASLVERADDRLGALRLVINATPLGLSGELPPVAPAALPRQAALLDLAYAPGETAWVRAGRAAGLRALDGLRLLVEQGAASFARWFGQPPDRAVLWRALGTVAPVPVLPRR
jgi:shikimate dehydrogenase